MASSLEKLEFHAMQFYPGSLTVQRYMLALAYLGRTDDAMVYARRMRASYPADYATQTWILMQACEKQGDGKLRALCTRLKSENLLVSAANSSVEKTLLPASQ
jgi:hypothetical protein